ncbi:hypothetical protein SMD44_06106 [Streptomyces alboflavus]|uniref:Uncharacterized protein n=1 Tax=Streptomyces alboflavus TaxID=67267 RepID=A0A1Z1WJL4_9ACTN|nr:hypothetical protein SMD44_06106 [Streptomyces alboflavus]
MSRRYTMNRPGVSFRPAATPTPSPFHGRRSDVARSMTTSAMRTRFTCPKSRFCSTGSVHSAAPATAHAHPAVTAPADHRLPARPPDPVAARAPRATRTAAHATSTIATTETPARTRTATVRSAPAKARNGSRANGGYRYGSPWIPYLPAYRPRSGASAASRYTLRSAGLRAPVYAGSVTTYHHAMSEAVRSSAPPRGTARARPRPPPVARSPVRARSLSALPV